MNGRVLTRIVLALLVGTLLVSAGAATALADSAADTETESDVTIDGLNVELEDVHVAGDGLPERNIEDRTYTIDEQTISIDGVEMTINGANVSFDDLSVTISDSTITVENVTIGGE
jgi:hypothetical protein